MPKSYTFRGFSNFQPTISQNSLFSAPNQFLDPIFGQVVAFYGLYKRYLGIFEILRFSAIFSPIKTQKMGKIAKNRDFWTSGPQKWPKISKSQKFPNNVWKTPQMQPLGQIWGPETDLGPKIRYDFKSPIENLKIPKMYRILPFFENSSRDNSTTEKAFSIP